ncbi:hypothetical protein TNCV_3553611 [Trichonephila clavipes]|nr:hypothetical protein TNCV_3553611 [Trichonephila clavipes]
MGCGLVINHSRPSPFPGNWYLFLVQQHIGGYISPQGVPTTFEVLQSPLHDGSSVTPGLELMTHRSRPFGYHDRSIP